MCGITGFWTTREDVLRRWREVASEMAAPIAHRGPDAEGSWRDEARGVVLAHRRLSIIDLSEGGRQPMTSACGDLVITYNGEVYNFEQLREELRAVHGASLRFRGHSDTEVILAAIATWGLRDALARFNGMFAMAIWDRRRRELHLVRDRLGIKPLYWGRADGAFVFASELSPLRRFPGFDGELDREAVALLMKYNNIPAPWSIHANARKLEPGTILTLSDGPNATPRIERYWSSREVARAGARDPFAGSVEEGVDALELALGEAVGARLVSDVPLGAFLSGGVDSSTVVALMQARSPRPVKTFSIGFTQDAYNEAAHAAEVATHLGTDHTELYVTPAQARELIPSLPQMYDEPFADSSQLPTHMVSRLARQSVTVSLSGDGGDELFGGYNRHVWGPRLWPTLTRTPLPLRQLAARVITSVAPRRWDDLFQVAAPWLPSALAMRLPGEKLHKLARVLDARDQEDFYDRLVSDWRHPERLVRSQRAPRQHELTPALDGLGFAERMMFWDLNGYLPNDILTKVDRASMAVSLEARVPLLDHHVVELAWRLPLAWKHRDGQSKWLLRQVLYRHVPRALIDRPKMGFGVPIDEWLRGPLRPWAEDLLSERALEAAGVFDPAPVRRCWREHLERTHDRQHHLWNVLMFQAWHRAQ